MKNGCRCMSKEEMSGWLVPKNKTSGECEYVSEKVSVKRKAVCTANCNGKRVFFSFYLP